RWGSRWPTTARTSSRGLCTWRAARGAARPSRRLLESVSLRRPTGGGGSSCADPGFCRGPFGRPACGVSRDAPGARAVHGAAACGIMLAVRILMVFVDGVGLGDPDPATNPLVRAATPTLRRLLGRPLAERAPVHTASAVLVPLDAQLGVPGLPQSGTGQAAILTGCNAPALVGRHVAAYPTRALKTLLEEQGMFIRLRRCGIATALANAYTLEYFTAVA